MTENLNAWHKILSVVKGKINPVTYSTWLRPTFEVEPLNGSGKLKVGLPDIEFLDYIETHFKDVIAEAIAQLKLPISQIEWVQEEQLPKPEPEPERPAVKSLSEVQLARSAPAIPELCWRGIFAEYRKLASKASEAADAFHFAGIAAAVSAALGKSVCLQDPVDVFPNLFMCVVGPPSGGKSDPDKFGLRTVLHQAVPDTLVLNSIDSAQGLISAIKRRGARAPAVVITLTEIRSLIEKSAQRASGDIVPKLNDLYDGRPRLEINTRNSFEEVDNPPPGVFLAASTPEWMEGAKREDLTGGLGSRIVFIPGDPKRGVRPKRQDFQPVIDSLKSIVDFWKAQPEAELRLSAEAEEVYWKWHDDRPSLSCPHRLIQAMAVRHRSYVLKFSLIYAAIEKSKTISRAHVEAALALIDEFVYPSLWHLFSDFSLSPWGKLEAKMIEIVKRAHPRAVRQRDLLRNFSHSQYERWMIRRALENVAGKFPDDSSWEGELCLVTIGRKVYVALNEGE